MKNEDFCKKETEDNTRRDDIRCECCYRRIDELKPFGGPGDPLRGDFSGQLLVKVGRYDFPKAEIPSQYSDCITKDGMLDDQKFKEKYGTEEYYKVVNVLWGCDIVSSYWLCRDCILLDREQFHKKLDKSYHDFMNTKREK